MSNTFKEKFKDSESSGSEHLSFQEDGSFIDDLEQHQVLLFIKQLENEVLELQQDCIEIIAANINPVSFISIIGDNYQKYGKIANNICQIKDSGFLSQSIRQNTGVWMYTKRSYNSKANCVIYYLLIKQTISQQLHSKVLSLISIISGSIIYVVEPPFSYRSIDILRFTSEFQNYVNFDQDQIVFELEQTMAVLNWLVITNNNLQDIKNSINRYLKNISRNKKSIPYYFPNRQIHTIIQQQNEKRNGQINEINKKILLNTSNKLFKQKNVNDGPMIAILIQKLIDTINTNPIYFDKIWKQIEDSVSETAYQLAIAYYIQMYDNNFNGSQAKGEELSEIILQMRTQTIKQFNRNAVKNKSQKQRLNLQQFLQKHETSIIQANVNACQIYNLKLLKEIKNLIQTNYYNGKYTTKELFDQQMQQSINLYNQKAKGQNKQSLLNDFLQNFQGILQNMINNPQQQNNIPQQIDIPLTSEGEYHQQNNNNDIVNQNYYILQQQQQLQQQQMQQQYQYQNQVYQAQMNNYNNTVNQKPKTQKCCLLF